VGRELWKSPDPTPLLKQGHLELDAQGCVQTASEYLQGWRLLSLSGQPVLVLGHPQCEKVFPDVQREPPACQSVHVACSCVLEPWGQ